MFQEIKKKDEFYSGLLIGKSKFVKKNRKQSASSTTLTTLAATTLAAITSAATTPVATTPTATTPTTPITPTMSIVLIESEEVAEASSRKKQKTVAGTIKKYYSDDNFPFTHKDINYFLNKFEEMNSKREISDIQKLLASSGIESDYIIENEFINKFVWKVANSTINKRIYLNESYLKSVATDCAELEFHEYFESWENKQIKEWKDSEKLKNAYERLYQRIDKKIVFGIVICQYMLNPKTELIKINDKEIRKIMKEEEEKEKEEREKEYENEVIFTGQSFRSRNNSLAKKNSSLVRIFVKPISTSAKPISTSRTSKDEKKEGVKKRASKDEKKEGVKKRASKGEKKEDVKERAK
ncbi:hypothetical protein Glove_112g36 [Diversispora epigaea]|uniref:Uncharacterized protein n=1 Tax=Diversispora epigaea TaxID=1348612 RepID=A0A397JBS4_9GLOM|nr:hypothetical protein Glove_112g36 [Diversispora epigaea]